MRYLFLAVVLLMVSCGHNPMGLVSSESSELYVEAPVIEIVPVIETVPVVYETSVVAKDSPLYLKKIAGPISNGPAASDIHE